MVRLRLQCVLWGCLLTAVHPELHTECRGQKYLLNSQCCSLCRPGEKLVDECTDGIDTKCRPCGDGEFLDTWNREKYCYQHKHCDHNLGLRVQRQGTSETDTTCACQEGLHCTSEACDSCAPHSSCSPGFGVKRIGTGISDTVCEPCAVGFFSNVSSAFEECHRWTRCETQNLIELQTGTDKADTVCGHWERPRAWVLIPITLGILCAIVLLVTVYIRKVVKKPKVKALHPEAVLQDPQETFYIDDHAGPNPAAPVQETLHGCQPVTQEDGKESRISVQERQ
ncbi:tumor necrosis factor receptor superfamily member 5 isoform X1 [Lemur catta]|uniref:tumor necrosis factor receptor superfamily member 5 isoform X1 n=1 Tax=Lemur catta TaxID=9447 RepID=UPI001E26A6A9|nr:tumor necrosis factor receptor superfamily member 5 isoform X1 [Lemur catta]